MGCFQVEAFLNSTLECFYNQTCMDRVNAMVNAWLPWRRNFTALNATRNLPNDSIYSVVSKLFVEKWSSSKSFTNYYRVCAPQSCSYEYNGRRGLILLITAAISIFGGLSTGLKIIFRVLLWFMRKVRYFLITFFVTGTGSRSSSRPEAMI